MVNKFQEYKELKSESEEKEREENRVREKAEAVDILSYIKGIGVNNAVTNNFWFKFEYKGLDIEFHNRSDGLDGEIHRPFKNMTDSEIVAYKEMIRATGGEYRVNSHIFDDNYPYVKFIFEGNHITAIKSIIQLVDDEEKEIIEKIKILNKQLKR